MTTGTIEPERTEAVQALFGGLVGLSRALRARSVDWGHAARDLTRGDLVTLGVLEARGSTRPGQIAVALNVDPSVVSRQLATLEPLGLVTRGTDPEDGRAELITITAQGRDQLCLARGAICDALAQRLRDWPLEDVTRATALVDDLAALLHQPLLTHSSHPHKDPHV